MKKMTYKFQIHKSYGSFRFLTYCLLLVTCFFLTACSSGGSTDSASMVDKSTASDAVRKREWVYVPKVMTVEDESVDYENMQLVGDTFCYVSRNQESGGGEQNICQYSIADGALKSIPVGWQDEAKNREIGSYFFSQDYSLCMIANVYSENYSQLRRFLCKFDPEGKSVFSGEITEQCGKDTSVGGLVMDEQGRVYIFSDAGILLYNGDGSYYGTIGYDSTEGVQIKDIAGGKDGKVYICMGNGQGADNNCKLAEVDFEGRQIKEIVKDVPGIRGFSEGTGQAKDAAEPYDFLLYDNSSVYGCNLSAQEREALFFWQDSDINGNFVESFGVLEDGRFYAIVEDWENEDRGIVLLTKTSAKEVVQKEEIVLATVNERSDLMSMAVRFNKGSEQYHITVKNYDSLTNLYNAILADEAVDLIDLSGVNVQKLSAQGVLEDLSSYVDGSSAFNRSDFLDGILDVYTFGDSLVSIPANFTLRTVVGNKEQLGSGAGMTLEELFTIVKENPGVQPFDGVTKEEMMQYLMTFNEESFIDWEKGECHFDSEMFKNVLGFVNGFPDSAQSGQEEVSLPNKIEKGEVMFAIADMNGLKSFQPYGGMFHGNAVCVGFPTMDGKGGTLLLTDAAFSIAVHSEHKEGAWKFIEGVLSREDKENPRFWFYFPTLKKRLDAMIDAVMEEDSQTSIDRFPADIYEDGWMFTYHAVTQEEIDVILDLLKEAKPAFYAGDDEMITEIINEEAQPYYNGQKSVEDVVSVIQNRIQIYVSENS